MERMDFLKVEDITIPAPGNDKADNAKRINYAKYRQDFLIDWRDIVADVVDESVFERTRHLVRTFAPIGHLDDVYQTLIAAYTLVPSALSHVLPILHLWGHSGCGKSSTAKIMDVIHGGNNIINGGTITYASVRNLINHKRNLDAGGFERNCLIILDDIKAQKFVGDDALYSFLRSGYDRSTDKCTRAGEKAGEIMEFHTFSAKVLTSVEMFIDRADLSELKRRTLVIPYDRSVDEVLQDVSEFNWQDINILSVWEDEENILAFIKARKSIKASFAKDFSPQEKSIGVDIGATLITCAGYTPREVKAWWSDLLSKQRALMEVHKSPLSMLLPNYLDGMLALKVRQIPTKEIKQLLAENNITQSDELPVLMNSLGWQLKLGTRGKICWCYGEDK